MEIEKEQELIVELINHPGWDLVERKLKILLDNANRNFHQATKESFDDAKGYYRGIKLVHDIFLEKTVDICNTQGIMKSKGEKL